MLALESFVGLALVQMLDCLLLVRLNGRFPDPLAFAFVLILDHRSLMQVQSRFMSVDGIGMGFQGLAVLPDRLPQLIESRQDRLVLFLPTPDIASPSVVFVFPVAVIGVHYRERVDCFRHNAPPLSF
jgi:hypothetical protein